MKLSVNVIRGKSKTPRKKEIHPTPQICKGTEWNENMGKMRVNAARGKLMWLRERAKKPEIHETLLTQKLKKSTANEVIVSESS